MVPLAIAMECPNCKFQIDDELIRSEGARLMNLSRINRRRKQDMSELGRIGGSRPKTPAGRRKRKKEIEEMEAEIRRLRGELAKVNSKAKR
jgi:ribosomal protein L44E